MYPNTAQAIRPFTKTSDQRKNKMAKATIQYTVHTYTAYK